MKDTIKLQSNIVQRQIVQKTLLKTVEKRTTSNAQRKARNLERNVTEQSKIECNVRRMRCESSSKVCNIFFIIVKQSSEILFLIEYYLYSYMHVQMHVCVCVHTHINTYTFCVSIQCFYLALVRQFVELSFTIYVSFICSSVAHFVDFHCTLYCVFVLQCCCCCKD